MNKNMMASTYLVKNESVIFKSAYQVLEFNIRRISSNPLISLVSSCHGLKNGNFCGIVMCNYTFVKIITIEAPRNKLRGMRSLSGSIHQVCQRHKHLSFGGNARIGKSAK